MYLHAGNAKLFKQFTAIALSLLLCQPTFAQSENQQMAFEGSLTDINGNAINLSGANLVFYIIANNCYLYGESSSAAGDGQGNISHRFGTGTVVPGSPNSFSQNLFFGNVNGTTTFAGNDCPVTAADTRMAQVYYADANIRATIKLGTVPYAQNATMLEGKSSSAFVQTSADTNTVFVGGSAGQYLTKSASGLTWSNLTLTAAQVTNALGYSPVSSTYTLTASAVTSALGYTPANNTALASYLEKSNNLGDLTSTTVARSNLGLGSLATKNSVNLATAEVTGTLSTSSLPSFSGDVSTAAGSSTTTIQGIRGIPISNTPVASGQVLVFNGTDWMPTSIPLSLATAGTVTNVSSSNSDITVTLNSTTPILTLNAGQGPDQILRLDATGRIPAVDASNVINLNAAQMMLGILPVQRLPSFAGDVNSASATNILSVTRLRGFPIASATPTANQVLAYNGVSWTPTTLAMGSVTSVSSSNGDIAVTSGTTTPLLTLNVGTGAGQIIRLDAAAKLPSVDASSLLNLNAANLSSGTLSTLRLPALSGDVTSVTGSGSVTVTKLRNIPISATAPTAGQVLSYVGGNWVPTNTSVGSVTNITAGQGLLGGSITSSGTIAVNFGNVSGTVAAGNDSRIVGALQAAMNLDDIVSATAARNNLGLGNLATRSSISLTSDVSGVLPAANGGSKWTQSASAAIYTMANVGIGVSSAAAKLHLASGTSTTPPLKMTAGSLLATPASGSIEFDGTNLYVTDQANTRRILAMASSLNSIDNAGTINNASSIILNPNNSAVIVSSTAGSSSYMNGAFIVKGGMGIAGNGNFSGSVNSLANLTASGSIRAIGDLLTSGSVVASGSISTADNVFAGTVITPYLNGSTASGGHLTIDATSHANKGNIIIANSGGNVGVGTQTPSYRFHIKSKDSLNYASVISASTGNAMMGTGEDSNGNLHTLYTDSAAQPRLFFTTSGTNYIKNNLSIGSTLEIPYNRLSVHGNATVTNNLAVSRTLILGGASTSSVPMQFVSSTLVSTPLAGALEFDGSTLLFTNAASQRRRVAGGITSGTIDNVTKISYPGGNLTLEGNTTSVTPAVIISNAGAGTVGLQVNDNVTVSGSIKLSAEGLDSATTCTASDEGKQRYNKTYHTMEFCDGTYWQGVAGVTHCTGSGTSFTLVGKPGTGSAFCMSKNTEGSTNYTSAINSCVGKATSNNSKAAICNETQYQIACKEYNTLGETGLTGFKSVNYWLPVPFANDGSSYFALQFTGTAGTCAAGNQSISAFAVTALTVTFRCCYD